MSLEANENKARRASYSPCCLELEQDDDILSSVESAAEEIFGFVDDREIMAAQQLRRLRSCNNGAASEESRHQLASMSRPSTHSRHILGQFLAINNRSDVMPHIFIARGWRGFGISLGIGGNVFARKILVQPVYLR